MTKVILNGTTILGIGEGANLIETTDGQNPGGILAVELKDVSTDLGDVYRAAGSTLDLTLSGTTALTAVVKGASTLVINDSAVWTVRGDSHIGNLTLTDASSIAAPEGYTLTMTVDGVGTPIDAGTYTGAIEISLVEL